MHGFRFSYASGSATEATVNPHSNKQRAARYHDVLLSLLGAWPLLSGWQDRRRGCATGRFLEADFFTETLLSVLGHDLSYRLVICVHLPFCNKRAADQGTPSRRSRPLILGWENAIRRIRPLCGSQHDDGRPFDQGFLNRNSVVRDHTEVTLPTPPHCCPAFNSHPQRIDEDMLFGHQLRNLVEVVVIDSIRKHVSDFGWSGARHDASLYVADPPSSTEIQNGPHG